MTMIKMNLSAIKVTESPVIESNHIVSVTGHCDAVTLSNEVSLFEGNHKLDIWGETCNDLNGASAAIVRMEIVKSHEKVQYVHLQMN